MGIRQAQAVDLGMDGALTKGWNMI